MPLALEVLLVNKEKGKRKKEKGGKKDRQENSLFLLFFCRKYIINHFLQGVKLSHFSPTEPRESELSKSLFLKGMGVF